MRIVIDTNLLIDAALDEYHFANRILDEVLEGKIEAFANRATIRENELMAGKKISDEKHLGKVRQIFGMIKPAPDIEERIRVISDRQDNKLLESAITSGSEYLITSDKEVLKVGEYQGVKIVTPKEFWAIYEDEKGDSWEKWVESFISNK
ncbi:MAG: putative toxin-antitoxin system toxin component, PIN family [Acidobacteriaceae bacterium]